MVRTNQGLGMGRREPMLGLAATWGIALVFVLGCGDDGGLGRRYPVHGRVTYRSQPLEHRPDHVRSHRHHRSSA